MTKRFIKNLLLKTTIVEFYHVSKMSLAHYFYKIAKTIKTTQQLFLKVLQTVHVLLVDFIEVQIIYVTQLREAHILDFCRIHLEQSLEPLQKLRHKQKKVRRVAEGYFDNVSSRGSSRGLDPSVEDSARCKRLTNNISMRRLPSSMNNGACVFGKLAWASLSDFILQLHLPTTLHGSCCQPSFVDISEYPFTLGRRFCSLAYLLLVITYILYRNFETRICPDDGIIS